MDEDNDDFEKMILAQIERSRYEARIYSMDGKYEKVFTNEAVVRKICECEHVTAFVHKTKDMIDEVENLLTPLKPKAASLILETKGGRVVSRMKLEDYFLLLELAKRVEISDRNEHTPETTVNQSTADEIQEFLSQLNRE